VAEEQHARSASNVLPPTVQASPSASIDLLAPMREAARTFESDIAASALAAVQSDEELARRLQEQEEQVC
jgi:hypothetical protein